MSGSCFVPHCDKAPGQKNSKGEIISFFQPQPDQSKEWLRLVGRADCLESQDNLSFEICEQHFIAEDINKDFEVVVDGEVVEFPREKKTLKPGAKPCFFPIQSQGESAVENPNASDRAISPVSVKSEHLSDEEQIIEPCSETDPASVGPPPDLFNTLKLASVAKKPTVCLERMDEGILAQYPVQRVSVLERAIARKMKMDEVGKDVGRRKRKVEPEKTSEAPVKKKKTEKISEPVKQKQKEGLKASTLKKPKAKIVKMKELKKGKTDKGDKKFKGLKLELEKSSRKVSKVKVELKTSRKVKKIRGRKAQDPRLTFRAGKATMKKTGTLKGPAVKKVQPKKKETDKPRQKEIDKRSQKKTDKPGQQKKSDKANQKKTDEASQKKTDKPSRKKTDKASQKKTGAPKFVKRKALLSDKEDANENSGGACEPPKKAAPIKSLIRRKRIEAGSGLANGSVRRRKPPAPPKPSGRPRIRKILRMSSSEDEDDPPAVGMSHAVPSTSQNGFAYSPSYHLSSYKPLIVPKPRPQIISKPCTPLILKKPLFIKKESSPFIVPQEGQSVLIDLTGPARAGTVRKMSQMPPTPQASGATPDVGSPITQLSATDVLGSRPVVAHSSGTPQAPGREVKLTKVNQVPVAVMKHIEAMIKKRMIPSAIAPLKVQQGVGDEQSGTIAVEGMMQQDNVLKPHFTVSNELSTDAPTYINATDALLMRSNLSPAETLDIAQTDPTNPNLSSSSSTVLTSLPPDGLLANPVNVSTPPSPCSPARDCGGDDWDANDVIDNVPTVKDTTSGSGPSPEKGSSSMLYLTGANVGNSVLGRMIPTADKTAQKVITAADLFSNFTASSKVNGDGVKETVSKPADNRGKTSTQKPAIRTANTVPTHMYLVPETIPSSKRNLNPSLRGSELDSLDPFNVLDEIIITEAPPKYSIHEDARYVVLPGNMWGMHQNDKMTVFLQIDESINVTKCVIFEKDNPPKVYCGTHEVQDFIINYNSKEDVQKILAQIHRWKLCIGTKSVFFWSFSDGCRRYFTGGSHDRRCEPCRNAYVKKLKNKLERKANNHTERSRE